MKTTENVKIDFKAMRERAGLTLEELAGRIEYSVAAVNGLENNGAGSKRLRALVFKALTDGRAVAVNEAPAQFAGDAGLSAALERARVAEEKLARVSALLAEIGQVLKNEHRPAGRKRVGG